MRAGGSSELSNAIGLAGADSAVPTGVPVSTQVARVEVLEPGQRRQRLHRRVDHVVADAGVLAQLRR